MRHSCIKTVIAVLVNVVLIFIARPTMAADFEPGNVRSTSHDENTLNEKSRTMSISMVWTKAVEPVDYTLVGYNFLFNQTASYTPTETLSYPTPEATSTTSETYSNKDGVAYYFHIRACFLDNSGEDYWGPVVTKAYYLDDTAPKNASISINDGAASTNDLNVNLTLGATNATKMRIASTSGGLEGATWVDYATSKTEQLSGTGTISVFVQFKDAAGNMASPVSDAIDYEEGALVVNPDKTTVTKGATLTVTASGGTTPYTFSVFEQDPAGAVVDTITAGDSTASVTFQGAGTCKIQVADSSATQLTAVTQTITVTVLSITPKSASLLNSGTVDFDPVYGTGPFTWSEVLDPNDAGAIDSSTGVFTADATNTGVVEIAVADAKNVTATATVTVSALSMAITAGSGTQSYTVGNKVPIDLQITVSSGGVGQDDYLVNFSVTADPNPEGYSKGSLSTTAGEVYTYTATTANGGIAEAPFFIGHKAGTYTILAKSEYTSAYTPASVANSPRTFSITGTAGAAGKLSKSSGDAQEHTVNEQLLNDFVVLVTDTWHNPVLGETIAFASVGGYTLTSATAVTNENGLAATRLTLGSEADTYTVTAAATSFEYTVIFTATAEVSANLDVDGNGSATALGDGVMIVRYLFGFTGSTLIDGAYDSANCTRCTAADIEAFLADAQTAILDVDGNGSATALGDGVMIVRYLFGFTGSTLIDGAYDSANCTRCTAADIEAYLATIVP